MTTKLEYILILSLCLLAGAGCSSKNEDPTPQTEAKAFPEAQGGGSQATGGRGGVVYYVTSLSDDVEEAGTLRYALKQTSTRTILFKVSGRIDLKNELRIKKGNVTIMGQSAPGDGICISGYPVIIEADNVIVRFLRFRMGDVNQVEGDALTCIGHKNVIIDHCSFSWSTDECVSCYGNTNFTLQYSFITESLRNSVHGKGRHGYGGIWGGKNASFHHNLLAHHDSRNPRFDHDYVNRVCAGPIDYVNNVVYNWGGNSSYGGEGTTNGAGGRHINMVNNYYKYGPATSAKNRLVDPTVKCDDYCIKNVGGALEPGKFWLAGNYMYGYADVTADNWKGSTQTGNNVKADARWTDGLTMMEHEQSAEDAFETVLSKAGCSLQRDVLDTRIVTEVRNGNATKHGSNGSTGGLIDTQSDAGGWPTYNSAELPTDTDGDGIPDTWENEHGLDPKSYADGKATTLNAPYTNLEVYLNELVAHLY